MNILLVNQLMLNTGKFLRVMTLLWKRIQYSWLDQNVNKKKQFQCKKNLRKFIRIERRIKKLIENVKNRSLLNTYWNFKVLDFFQIFVELNFWLVMFVSYIFKDALCVHLYNLFILNEFIDFSESIWIFSIFCTILKIFWKFSKINVMLRIYDMFL